MAEQGANERREEAMCASERCAEGHDTTTRCAEERGAATRCAEEHAAPSRCAAEVPAAGQSDAKKRRAAVFCVGNRLMLDEGIGPAVYDELVTRYRIPDNVKLFDVGCMSLDMLPYVEQCDFILTVDAVDSTGQPAGTVFRFDPEAMARHSGAMASLHDLKLVDLFDAAQLLGYDAEGFCVGMQVENMSPEEYVVGLTPACFEKLPLLVETAVAELARRRFVLEKHEQTSASADTAR